METKKYSKKPSTREQLLVESEKKVDSPVEAYIRVVRVNRDKSGGEPEYELQCVKIQGDSVVSKQKIGKTDTKVMCMAKGSEYIDPEVNL